MKIKRSDVINQLLLDDPLKQATLERLDLNTEIDILTGCWNWNGTKDPDGYGQITVLGNTMRTHRLKYCLTESIVLTKGLCVCHSCDNPSCLNPSHLWVGTTMDNTADRNAKQRTEGPGKGINHPNTSFTEADILTIRTTPINKGTVTNLAKFYGVHAETIRAILKRRSWKHI